MTVAANLAVAAHYSGRIYPNVSVAGANLGGLDRGAARARLSEQLRDYRLDIEVGRERYEITPAEAGASYDIEAMLDMAFASGERSGWSLPGLWTRQQSSYAYNLNNDQFNALVSSLSAQQSLAAVDANITVVNGVPAIAPEQDGRGIDPIVTAGALRAAIASGERQVRLEPSATPAQIRSTALTSTLAAATAAAASKVELSYQGRRYVPSPSVIGSWLMFPPSGASRGLEIDPAKVKAYLGTLARQIDVKPVAKRLTVINGEVKAEAGGVEGLMVDQDALTTAIAGAVKTGAVAKLDIPTRPVAFKTEYNRTVSLDYGRYVEINLATQQMWAYQDHQVVYSSPITSGAAGIGRPTIQGLFSVYTKQRNRYLNGYQLGYNYNVFVEFWMPFSGNYGMHDASWRASFGGPDYYYGGSSGCVNMPRAAAAWLWDWAPVGTPVWVHS